MGWLKIGVVALLVGAICFVIRENRATYADVLVDKGMPIETVRVSINETGEQGNGISRRAAMSADGAWVAFSSNSFNLTDEDQSPVEDVFVYERATGALDIISTVAEGEAQDGDSIQPRLSGDGGAVVWESSASNLVSGDGNQVSDIFWRDRTGGEIVRLSVNGAGEEGNGGSHAPDISADGAVMVFESVADNLVIGDTNGVKDIFVTSPPNPPLHDGEGGFMMVRVSVASDGTEANGESWGARVSGDGRYVVYTSEASNLVVGDTNNVADVFVHDRDTGVTERVSVGNGGIEGDRASGGGAVSADGRYVAFESLATPFSEVDSYYKDVFVRDRERGETTLVSVNGAVAANHESYAPAMSADGRSIVFAALADNLVAGDTNGYADIFRKDRVTGDIVRLSVSDAGIEANGESRQPAISGDGSVAAFESAATNLVAGDTNGLPDVFMVTITETPTPAPGRLYLPLVRHASIPALPYE